jgi:hypothetical protein
MSTATTYAPSLAWIFGSSKCEVYLDDDQAAAGVTATAALGTSFEWTLCKL